MRTCHTQSSGAQWRLGWRKGVSAFQCVLRLSGNSTNHCCLACGAYHFSSPPCMRMPPTHSCVSGCAGGGGGALVVGVAVPQSWCGSLGGPSLGQDESRGSQQVVSGRGFCGCCHRRGCGLLGRGWQLRLAWLVAPVPLPASATGRRRRSGHVPRLLSVDHQVCLWRSQDHSSLLSLWAVARPVPECAAAKAMPGFE